MSSRAAMHEVLTPKRLWQRGQFLTWPAEQKWGMLRSVNVTTVVNLWTKVDPDLSAPSPNGGGILYINWPITSDRVPPETDSMVAFLATLMITKPGGMLVHCEAGVNRSAWLCARLIAAVEIVSRPDALEWVTNRINRVNLRPALAADLAR